jgi:hypothetical protein
MSKKSTGARARQITGLLALCTAAVSAHAEPISLTATCYLRSQLPGEGTCDLVYSLSDNFLDPSSARLGQVRVDNKLVAQFVNDTENPVEIGVALVSGSVQVACGATHTMTAQIAAVGASTPYVRVGSVPSIRCPNAL